MAYATAEELAAILKVNATTNAGRLEQVLDAATGEIDSEIDLAEGVTLIEEWKLALAAQVNIERAVELWHSQPVGFNVIGLDTEAPVRLASDSWRPYAHKLAPLKGRFGIA